MSVVRVHDDEGRVGFGAGDPLRGLVDYLHLFLGRDPLDLDRHGAVLTNISFLDGRPWPLDTALWDLAGKVTGRPIWAMVGGAGRSVGLYASWGRVRPPEASAELARETVAAGYGAIKLRLGRAGGFDEDVAAVAAVRDAVGPDIGVMVDCNQGWRMPWDVEEPWAPRRALEVAERLASFGIGWIEEPLHRGDHAGMAWLRARSPVPVAGGEMTRELHELELMLDRGCLDVYQPDVVTTGGFTALAGFARAVAERGHVFTPHTWGSGVALLANAHLTAGTVGTRWLEYPLDPPDWTPERRDFILAQPVLAHGGRLDLGDRPGLGVDLDEDRLQATLTDAARYD